MISNEECLEKVVLRKNLMNIFYECFKIIELFFIKIYD